MRFISFSGLWRHREFRKLWAGQASSLLGTQGVFLILPLAAVVVLDATPFQMGIVTAMGGIPAILGLFLGAWADRRRRLPILVGADVGRALLLLVVPVAHVFDMLTVEVIYFVAFGIGLTSILFEIGYRSFLPSVVEPHQLVEANSKLEMARSATSAIGPSIGGVLVQAFTAPFAMLFGVSAYFVSALFFRSIRVQETGGRPDAAEETRPGSILDGLRFYQTNSMLLGIATSQFTLVSFSTVFETVILVYVVRELGLTPGVIGATVAAGSLGSFVGASIASRISNAFGIGRTATFGVFLIGTAAAVIPGAGGPTPIVVGTLIVAKIAIDAANVIYMVGAVSLRQSVTPDHMQGRVTSVSVVLSRAGIPVGALAGGLLGELIGIRATLFVGATGMAASSLWLVYFRVWSTRLVAEAPASAT